MKEFRGEMSGGELLLTEHDDGTREIAFRADQWETWSPPTVMHPVPYNTVAVTVTP